MKNRPLISQINSRSAIHSADGYTLYLALLDKEWQKYQTIIDGLNDKCISGQFTAGEEQIWVLNKRIYRVKLFIMNIKVLVASAVAAFSSLPVIAQQAPALAGVGSECPSTGMVQSGEMILPFIWNQVI